LPGWWTSAAHASDCDPDTFSLILGYLRRSCRLVDHPSDPQLQARLRHDADFFGLEGLLAVIDEADQAALSADFVKLRASIRASASVLTKPYHHEWDRLRPLERAAAEALGYSLDTWDAGETQRPGVDGGRDDASYARRWKHLTNVERVAAQVLGYDKESWDSGDVGATASA